MPDVHRIRLRGPWQAQALESVESVLEDGEESALPWMRVSVPHRWTEPPFESAAAVRYQRRFNKPTGLSAAEAVWLVVADFGPALRLRLNAADWHVCSADDAPLRVEITSQLLPSNRLTLAISREQTPRNAPVGFLGEVALEIGPS